MSIGLSEDQLWDLRRDAARLRHEAEILVERSGSVRRELARTDYVGGAADDFRGRMSLRDRAIRSLAVDLEEASLAILHLVAALESGPDGGDQRR